jgi:hypothetical protein
VARVSPSGKTIATSDGGLEQKLLGVAGALGSIVAGFAVGGPLGAGLAGVSTLVGFITTKIGEAAAEQEKWNGLVKSLTAGFIDAKNSADALGANAARNTAVITFSDT